MERFEWGVGRAIALGFVALMIPACGGGSGGSATPPPVPTSYIGTNGAFAAAANPANESSIIVFGGSAGKRQFLRGTVDLVTGKDLGQAAGIEMYKSQDGHIYAVDMTAIGTPAPVQVSSESAATIDDACTFGGVALPGSSADYIGVYAAPDYANPVNYSYFYRLAGPDGQCGTADDVIHMVHPGMKATDSPLVADAMPAATTYNPGTGAVWNYIAKVGTDLVALDPNGALQGSLATFAAPIQVLTALPNSNANGLPSGGLFVVDGDIVHVDYASGAVTGSLFTIPHWTPTTILSAAASPTTLYFAIVTPATGSAPASSVIYSMPLDGTAAAAAIDTEVGYAGELTVPAQSTQLLFGVTTGAPSYSIKAISTAGGAPNTLVTVNQNGGRFVATAASVYYTSFLVTGSNATGFTRSGILSGIVAIDGTQIVPQTAASEFMIGGQQTPSPSGTPLWTPEPLSSVLRIRNLTSASVTVVDAAGITTTTPALSGGLVESIDTASNQVTASIGTMPASTATYLTDTFRVLGNVGFIDATNDASTPNPGTRDLYLIDTAAAGSLLRVTQDL